MINHSPAQLIAEIERLMDMDYELLPGARHVLEEAIAVIRPLAEKPESPVGEMIDPLRALVAQWRAMAAAAFAEGPIHGDEVGHASRWETMRICAEELEALLSAPVVTQEDQELEQAPIIPGRNPRSWTITESAPVVSDEEK